MKVFLSASVLTDAVRCEENEKGLAFRSAGLEFIGDRDQGKVLSECVRNIAFKKLDRLDELYRILCDELSTASYDPSVKSEVVNVIKNVVNCETASEVFDGEIPNGVANSITALQEEMIEDADTDPLTTVANARESVRSRKKRLELKLSRYVDSPNTEVVKEVRDKLAEETGSEVVGIVCGSAAGWWAPRPKSVPVAITSVSPLNPYKADIDELLSTRTESPAGIDLRTVETSLDDQT